MTTCQHPGRATKHQPAVACTSDTWGGTGLCGVHLRALQADVADIARVMRLLDTFHNDLVASGGDDTARMVPSSRPPMRLALLDVITGRTAQRITGWASDVVRTSRALSVRESALILERNIDALACHVVVADIAVELNQCAADCRAVLPDDHWNTSDDDKRIKPVGRCTRPHPDDPARDCNGPLHWITATLIVRCAKCHHQQEPDGWVSKRLVLRAFGLSRWTLNRWVADGKVAASTEFIYVDDVREQVRKQRGRRDQCEGA